MIRTPLIFTLLALTSCAGWGNLPVDKRVSRGVLWAAQQAVPTHDGLYIPLIDSGAVALVKPNGTHQRVDVGEGTVERVTVAPDQRTVLAFVDRYACDYKGEGKAPKTVDGCPAEDLVRTTEIGIIDNGRVRRRVDMDGVYNAVEYAEDNRYAIGYLDYDDPTLRLDGVLNLTSVMVLDMVNGTAQQISVGFAADRVLISHDAGGQADRALVLSRSEVAVIDLTGPTPTRGAVFPLTLDPDTVVDPRDVVLTPDGEHALIAIDNSPDLYSLDLVNSSINIIELSAAPSSMQVNTAADETVLVYGGSPIMEVLEHQFFEVERYDLDEAMSRVVSGSDFALLWDARGRNKDFYRFDLGTRELVEYRLENPAVSLHVAPTEEFAVMLTRAEDGFQSDNSIEGIYDAHPGMEIIDLDDDDTTPFILEGLGLGVAFSATGTALHALVLQEGVDYLYQLDLYTREEVLVELDEPAVDIGSMPDGTFFITHDTALGLVSFYDAQTGRIKTASGFAALGLFDEVELSTGKGGK